MKNKLSGLYVITDKKLIDRDSFIQTVERAIKGGAQIVQLREKETTYGEIVMLGKELLKITRAYDVPLIINDYPEIAREVGADGVHLGADNTTVEHARLLLGSDAIIGDREPTSIEILKEAVRLINVPIFAIGGITKDNAKPILDTGVDGIAVITSVFGSSDPETSSRELASLTNST